jgi:hypothetical protein
MRVRVHLFHLCLADALEVALGVAFVAIVNDDLFSQLACALVLQTSILHLCAAL